MIHHKRQLRERNKVSSVDRLNMSDEIRINGVRFTLGDLFNVVDDFYARVQVDPILKVPFHSVHDWPDHIQRITHFWWIRFGGKPYLFAEYNPVLKHFFAGFNTVFLTQWLKLFHETLREHLNEEQSNLWKVISERMGHSLSIKNDYFKEHYEINKNQS